MQELRDSGAVVLGEIEVQSEDELYDSRALLWRKRTMARQRFEGSPPEAFGMDDSYLDLTCSTKVTAAEQSRTPDPVDSDDLAKQLIGAARGGYADAHPPSVGAAGRVGRVGRASGRRRPWRVAG